MKNRYVIFIILLIVLVVIFPPNKEKAYADELSDTIKEQIENIDLNGLEDYFNSVINHEDKDFYSYLNDLLNGKYSFSFNSFFEYFFNLFFSNVYDFIPILLSIIAIAIFCGIINSVKGSFVSKGISDVIFFVCLISIILLLSGQIVSLFIKTRNTINNLSKLTEIMSPIIITLMLASGGKVSAGIYKPAVAFLSNGIVGICSSIIFPLVGVMSVFGILSNFSESIKLKKFSEFTTSIIKWIMGITITVFGLFMTIQGITSATFDGISIRATKYAISNSIPIVGGLLKDGFDLIVAGNVLIKNTVGVVVLVGMLFTVLAPIVQILCVSLMLKLISAITEPIADIRISDFCMTLSKSLSYLLSVILMVGFMVFITVLLMIFSANAFI